MSLINYKSISKDFLETVDRKLANTLNFENSCNRDEYANTSIVQHTSTSKGIHFHDNVFITKYLEYFQNNSNIVFISDAEYMKYRYRPKSVSLRYYDTTDYWYIILMVNGFNSSLRFTNFSSLLIPIKSVMDKAIDNELYKNPVETTDASYV